MRISRRMRLLVSEILTIAMVVSLVPAPALAEILDEVGLVDDSQSALVAVDDESADYEEEEAEEVDDTEEEAPLTLVGSVQNIGVNAVNGIEDDVDEYDDEYEDDITDDDSNQRGEPVATVTHEGGAIDSYATLQKAVTAAVDGDTVTLLTDLSLPRRVDVKGKTLIIDLGGHVMTVSSGCKYGCAFFASKDSHGKVSDVTIQNGILSGVDENNSPIVAEGDGDYNEDTNPIPTSIGYRLTSVDGVSSITFRNGGEGESLTLVVNSQNGSCVYANSGGSINIKSGTFKNLTTEQFLDTSFVGMTVKQGGSTQDICITGGTFVGNDPQLGANASGVRALNEGYVAVPAEGTDANGNGTFTVVEGSTVTFETDGGTDVVEQRVATGGKATKPADPTKENALFAGWYAEGATEAFDFEETPINADLTLTAKWMTLSASTLELYPNDKATISVNNAVEGCYYYWQFAGGIGSGGFSGTTGEGYPYGKTAGGTGTATLTVYTDSTKTTQIGNTSLVCNVTVEDVAARVDGTEYTVNQFSDAVAAAIANNKVLEVYTSSTNVTLTEGQTLKVKAADNRGKGSVTVKAPAATADGAYAINKTTDAESGVTTYVCKTMAVLVEFTPADGGEKTYSTSLSMGSKAGTYKLLGDIASNGRTSVTGTGIVLDLNGHTINFATGSKNPAILLGSTAKTGGLTITDTSEAGTGAIINTGDVAVWSAYRNSTVTIEGGTIQGALEAIYTSNGSTATINGGTFKVSGNDTSFLLNCQDDNKKTITVTGGTFYGFDPSDNAADGTHTNYVKDGYTSTFDEDNDAYTVSAMASIQYYNTWSVPNTFYFADENPIPSRTTQGTVPTIKRKGESSYHVAEDWVQITWQVTTSDATSANGTASTIASVDENGLVTFTAPGTVKVWLTMTDPSGATKSSSKTVSYKEAPAYVVAADGSKTAYASLYSAFNAAQDGETVVMGADYSTNNLGKMTLSNGRNFTVDLNGHTAALSANYRTDAFGALFTIESGSLTIVDSVGGGSVSASGTNARAFNLDGTANAAASDAVLTIGEGVSVSSATDCCVTVFGKATLNTGGNLSSPADFAIAGNGSTGNEGYVINVTGGTVAGDEVAIYHPNDGAVTISGGTITGATAVYQKAGTLNITGGTLQGTGEKAEFVHNGNGANATGDALVVESCKYPGGMPTTVITGTPTISSDHGAGIGDYTYGQAAEPQITSVSNTIELPAGEMWVSDGNGSYVIGNAPLADGTVYASAEAAAETLADTLYNKYTNGQSIAAPEGYYVKAVKYSGNPESITLNDTVVNATDTFKLSIGNNAFVQDKYYKVVDGDLYLAFPIVLFELANGGSIELTKENSQYTLSYDNTEPAAMSVTSTKSQDERYIKISGEGASFNITANSAAAAHYWVGFDLAGVDSTKPLITKKVNTRGETTTTTYGFSAVDGTSFTGGTNGGIAYYPFGWSDAVAKGAYGTTAYSIYSVGSGKLAQLSLSLNATQPEAVETLYADAQAVATAYEETHYNKHSNGDSIEAGNDFYVKAATGNGFLGEPESITINGITYGKDDTFDLSVGMNAMVTGTYFQVKDDGLYVAFPVVLFDMNAASTIEVGDYAFAYAANANTQANVTAVRGQKVTGSAIEVAAGTGDNAYTVTHSALKPATEWVEVAIEGLAANQVMITKKVYTNAAGSSTTSYGMTKPDTSAHDGNDPVLAFYAFGYSDTTAPTSRNGASYDYQAYLVGSGKTATMTLNLACKAVTVTFDSDGGSAVASATIDAGTKVARPADPTKANFVFQSWNKVVEGQVSADAFDFETPVATDITLKATYVDAVASVTHGEDVSYYASLVDAVEAATSGDTIKMLANDGTLTTYVEIPASKALTLDLNGKTITSTGGGFDVYGTFSITDTSEGKDGKIVAARQGLYVNASAAASMDAGTIEAAWYGFRLEGNTTLEFSGTAAIVGNGNGIFNEGTVTMSGGSIDVAGMGVSNTGTFTITAGTIDGDDSGIYAHGSSTTNVQGGKVFSTDDFAISTNGTGNTDSVDYSHNAVINVSGGEVTSTHEAAVYVPAGTLNVTGGTVTGSTGIFMRAGTLNIPSNSTAVISGTGADNAPAFDPSSGDGANSTGDAVSIVASNYPQGLSSENITIAGGTFNSANGDPVATYAQKQGIDPVVEFVTGGTFNKDFADDVVVSTKTALPSGDVYTVGNLTVAVNPTTLNGVAGNTAQLTATTNGSDENIAYTWESGDDTIATVDANGKVTYIAEGTTTISAAYHGTTATCDVTVTDAVASVTHTEGETTTVVYTASLVDAVAAAASGDTIQMLQNEAQSSWVEITKDLTIDLNGKTLSRAGNALLNPIGAKLTVTDTSEEGTGKVISNIPVYLEADAEGNTSEFTLVKGAIQSTGTTQQTAIYSAGSNTITISGGAVEGNGYGILTTGNSDITINGGAITSNAYGINAGGTSTIRMTGGSITATAPTASDSAWGIAVFDNATVNVSGGTITSSGIGISTNGNAGQTASVSVSGGKISGEIGIYAPSGTLAISDDAKITGDTGVYFKAKTLNVSGGTITGTGEKKDYNYNGNGANATGDALVIDSCNYPESNDAAVTITGGTFASTNAKAVGHYKKDASVATPAAVSVSGGTFTSDIADDMDVAATYPLAEYPVKTSDEGEPDVFEIKPSLDSPDIEVMFKDHENESLTTAPTYAYTGEAIEPVVGVKIHESINQQFKAALIDIINDTSLDDDEYQVTYLDANGNEVASPTDAGTYKAVIEGLAGSKFAGTQTTRTFSIATATITEVVAENLTFNGFGQTPTLVVKADTFTLTEDDYTAEYYATDENGDKTGDPMETVRNVGTYIVVVKAADGSNYSDGDSEISATFEVEQATLSESMLSGFHQNMDWDAFARAVTQGDAVLKLGEYKLVLGEDYTIDYAENTSTGLATATFQGKDNCTGEFSKHFAINGISISDAVVTLVPAEYTYDGEAKTPQVTVTFVRMVEDDAETKTLVEGTDYTVTYSANTNAGTASVFVVGQGNYTGAQIVDFAIKPATITVADIAAEDVTGNPITPEPVVTVGTGDDAWTVPTDDYTVSYVNNVEPGTATVTIIPTSNYTPNSVVKTFIINGANKTELENAMTAANELMADVYVLESEDDSAILDEGEKYILRSDLEDLADAYQAAYATYNDDAATQGTVDGVAEALVAATEAAENKIKTIGSMVATTGGKKYATLAEAVAAAGNYGDVTLLKDIELTETQIIEKDLSIDLNGHSIVGKSTRALWIKSGNVSIYGNGAVSGIGEGLAESSSVIRVGDSATNAKVAALTVDSDVLVFSTRSYGITTFGKNEPGIKLDVYGMVSVFGSENGAISGNGSAGLAATDIVIHEGAQVESAAGAAIYFPGQGNLSIQGGIIQGPTGVYVKCGSTTIEGGSIKGFGDAAEFSHSGNGLNSTGDALVVENCGYPYGAPQVSVLGGTFESEHASAVASYATEGNEQLAGFVSAEGTAAFSDDSETTYVAVPEGKVLVQGEDNLYRMEDCYLTVTFVNGDETTTAQVLYGQTVDEPEEPSRDDAIFDGWTYTDPETGDQADFDFATAIKADLTLTAQWTDVTADIADTPEVNELFYNGKDQVGIEAGEGYVLYNGEEPYDGAATGKDAGEYTTIVKLEPGYEWDEDAWDDDTEFDDDGNVVLTWAIEPSPAIILVEDVEVTYGDAIDASDLVATAYGLYGDDELEFGTPTTTYVAGDNVGYYEDAITLDVESPQGNYAPTVMYGDLYVQPRNIAELSVAAIEGQIYSGSAIEPELTVSDPNILVDEEAKVLEAGTDYTVTYANNTKVGVAKATVEGKGNYTGSTFTYFAINKADESNLTISTVESVVYNGERQTPAVTIMDGNTTLEADKDYKLVFVNNVEVGTATVTAVLKGNYEGALTTTFEIVKPDKDALEDLLDQIEDELVDVYVSDKDGFDLEVGKKYANNDAWDALTEAIVAADDVLDSDTATADQIAAAKDALATAYDTFKDAINTAELGVVENELTGMRYPSLADAVADAEDGAVLTMLDDDTIEEPIVVDKSLTLDLHDCFVIALGFDDCPVLQVTGEDTKVSIIDEGADEDKIGLLFAAGNAPAIEVSDGAELTTHGGYYESGDSEGPAVTVDDAKLIVNDGFFEKGVAANTETYEEGDIVINGGSFVDFDPSDNNGAGEHSNFVPEPFTGRQDEDDESIWNVVEKDYVAIPDGMTLTYNGAEQTGVAADEITDTNPTARYTIEGNTATSVGEKTATATLVDTKNYIWMDTNNDGELIEGAETDIYWTIEAAQIADATIVPISETYENGNPIEFVKELKIGDNTLPETDYTITYVNNDKAGTAVAIIEGKNNLEGTTAVTFNILAIPNKDVLQEKVGEAGDLLDALENATTYDDPESIPDAAGVYVDSDALAALADVKGAAEQVLNNPKSTQEQITDAAQNLADAIAAVEDSIVDKRDFSDMEDALADAQQLSNGMVLSEDGLSDKDGNRLDAGTDYVKPSDKDALDDAIKDAQEALDAMKDDLSATQDDIKDATDALKDAIAAAENAKKDADHWERIWGQNGYDTMKAIVNTEGVFTAGNTDTVVIASRTSWEDPLAATALAGVYNAPLLLVGKANQSLTSQTKSELKRLKPKRVIVIGDTDVVSKSTFNEIKSAAGTSNVTRVIGKNYIERANGMFRSTTDWRDNTAIIATHNSFRDTLSASPFAYAQKYPILFVGNRKSSSEGGRLEKSTVDLLKSRGVSKVIIMGGEIAVSRQVEKQLSGVEVVRWYGQNALNTSAVIAKHALDDYNMTIEHLSVARSDGNNYVDALAGAALTGRLNSVLVLADSRWSTSTGAAAFNEIKDRLPGKLVHGHVYGGELAISEAYYQYFHQYQ